MDEKTINNTNEEAFGQWMRTNDEKKYKENTIKRYINALNKVEEWLNIKLKKPVFYIEELSAFKKVEKEIRSVKDFMQINLDHGRGDLSAALSLYRKFLETKYHNEDFNNIKEVEETMSITQKEAINEIKMYIEDKGFSYPDGLIENYYLCLKTKPFVILAGISGTGKTRLVKLFAEAINASFKLVPVRPDWSDSTDLFGHMDLNSKFVPGEILQFISDAMRNPNVPYILCLDEMNLARVEYYLSDFLSVMETRDLVGKVIISDPIITKEKYGNDSNAYESFGEIRFPENFYMIGTVNMDETTFPFSKKVLDRANTLEFNYVDLIPVFQKDDVKVKRLTLPNSFLKTEYLLFKQCYDDAEIIIDICKELQRINEILKQGNAHVGYRVRDEIVFYMINNKKAELLSYNEAFDNQIMQKILPRIQGSSRIIKNMLCELFEICSGNHGSINLQDHEISKKMDKVVEDGKLIYPRSAQKIAFMVQRFEEDGFTSYWL